MISARFLRGITKYQRPEEARRFLRLDRYWHPEVAEQLLKRIDEIVAKKPKPALGLAEIALELVKRIRNPPRALQAHAHCSIATALRNCGRFKEASGAFRRAEDLVEDSSPLLFAQIARQKAVLLAEQGQMKEALSTARKAVAADRSAGIFPQHSLIGEGIVRGLKRDFAGSCECFLEVLQKGDPQSESYLYAMKNYVASLLQRPLLGSEIVEARKSLRRVQERIRGVRETPVRYDIWFIEAQLHLQMEEFAEAIDHLIQARTGYLRLESIPDFARASIELIDILVKKGDLEKAQITIERTANQIADFEEHKRFAELFLSAQQQPVAQAAEFLRSGIS